MENLVNQTYNVIISEPITRRKISELKIGAKSSVFAAHIATRKALAGVKKKTYALASVVPARQAMGQPATYLMSITPESGETAGKLIA